MMHLLARMRANGQEKMTTIASRCEYFEDGTYHFLGGAGVIMTRSAIDTIVRTYGQCPFQIGKDMYFYDVSISKCLRMVLDQEENTKNQPNCIDQIELHRDHVDEQCTQEGLRNNVGSIRYHLGDRIASVHYVNTPELLEQTRAWWPLNDPLFSKIDNYCSQTSDFTPTRTNSTSYPEFVEQVTVDQISFVKVSDDDDILHNLFNVYNQSTSTSEWFVVAKWDSCVNPDSLAFILSRFSSSIPLYVGSEASKRVRASDGDVPYGAGFAVNRKWIEKLVEGCNNFDQDCIKKAKERMPDLLSDGQLQIVNGVFLEMNPALYCTEKGRWHSDAMHTFDREHLAIFPSYDEENCVINTFWQYRPPAEKEEFGNYQMMLDK
ncbi:hypothetical protein AKO1_008488 [Acrasis kona]|uniref:Uncharacterized protein n=1 Tax=Acrasis kona TaxID=1008807 RepID=A0AAW2YLP0_9EUKA